MKDKTLLWLRASNFRTLFNFQPNSIYQINLQPFSKRRLAQIKNKFVLKIIVWETIPINTEYLISLYLKTSFASSALNHFKYHGGLLLAELDVSEKSDQTIK